MVALSVSDDVDGLHGWERYKHREVLTCLRSHQDTCKLNLMANQSAYPVVFSTNGLI